MIKARLLNSEASINDFFLLSQLDYVPGENLTIVIQLHDAQKNIRFIPTNLNADVKFRFVDKTSSTPIEKTAAVVDALDRSMWTVSLSQTETGNLSGANIEIEYDENNDDVTIFKTIIRNVLVRRLLSGVC